MIAKQFEQYTLEIANACGLGIVESKNAPGWHIANTETGKTLLYVGAKDRTLEALWGFPAFQSYVIEQWRNRTDKTAGTRNGVMARLAYWHGGHNASETSTGRLGMQCDLNDDEAVASYFYHTIRKDAEEPLKAQIQELKAQLFDLQEAAKRKCKKAKKRPNKKAKHAST